MSGALGGADGARAGGDRHDAGARTRGRPNGAAPRGHRWLAVDARELRLLLAGRGIQRGREPARRRGARVERLGRREQGCVADVLDREVGRALRRVLQRADRPEVGGVREVVGHLERERPDGDDPNDQEEQGEDEDRAPLIGSSSHASPPAGARVTPRLGPALRARAPVRLTDVIT